MCIEFSTNDSAAKADSAAVLIIMVVVALAVVGGIAYFLTMK